VYTTRGNIYKTKEAGHIPCISVCMKYKSDVTKRIVKSAILYSQK